jgi:hypothetical protein
MMVLPGTFVFVKSGKTDSSDPSARWMSWLLALLGFLAAVAVGVTVFLLLRGPAPPTWSAADATPPAEGRPVLTYVPTEIGLPVEGHPMITHVAIYDLDGDGLPDILVCDGTANQVSWIRQFPRGVFTEYPLGDPIPGPAHVSVADINGDGKPDLLVASMGVIMPDNDLIGKVVILENLGGGRFRNHVVAENIPRVTDVRGVDFNGDGRIDLVVGQFGYNQGEIRWMENLGDWKFRSHILLEEPGTIMTPVADFDRDGKPDFAAVIAQESQEVHLFHNLGDGNFEDKVIWKSPNQQWNSSGLEVADMNGDGLPDLLYSNGDGFDSGFYGPPPWHGLQWLENRGDRHFVYHRIGDSPGCYSPIAVDLNGDGHLDIVTVSAFNKGNDTSSVWLTAWLNDGHEKFTPVPLAHAADSPTHLITVAAGDLDGNGVPVLVTGGFFVYPPYTHMNRVTLWRRKK